VVSSSGDLCIAFDTVSVSMSLSFLDLRKLRESWIIFERKDCMMLPLQGWEYDCGVNNYKKGIYSSFHLICFPFNLILLFPVNFT